MNKVDVSVIIPTKDRPHYLNRAINSLKKQDEVSFELIIVNDGGSEVEIPENLAFEVILFSLEKNVGISAARNYGVKNASGTWITFIDDDDELLPGSLNRSIEFYKNDSSAEPKLLISAMEVVNKNGKLRNILYPPSLNAGKYFGFEKIDSKKSFITKQTLFIKRDVFIKFGGFDESFKTRVYTEIFLRFSKNINIIANSIPSYRHYKHRNFSLSKDKTLRKTSFRKLLRKHFYLKSERPDEYRKFIFRHIKMCYKQKIYSECIFWIFVLKILRIRQKFSK